MATFKLCTFTFIYRTRINDIAIAMSYSSRAEPGLRVAFKHLNAYLIVTALAAWLEAFKCLN